MRGTPPLQTVNISSNIYINNNCENNICQLLEHLLNSQNRTQLKMKCPKKGTLTHNDQTTVTRPWLAVLNAFPTQVGMQLKHSSNLYFVNLELEMSAVTMRDYQLSSSLGQLHGTPLNNPRKPLSIHSPHYILWSFLNLGLLLNRSKNQWLPAYPYKINLHT
jgi:hypothetical protein